MIVELTLSIQDKDQVKVLCNGDFSHSFNLLQELGERELLKAMENYDQSGQQDGHFKKQFDSSSLNIFRCLFPERSPSNQALANSKTDYILLVADDNRLQQIPWELACGPHDDFLVKNFFFARSVPKLDRILTPDVKKNPPLFALPSRPLDPSISELHVQEEWLRLKEIVEQVPYGIELVRVFPCTLERLGELLVPHTMSIVHFMGHGGSDGSTAFLIFEEEDGSPRKITAKDFKQRTKGKIFLLSLNACSTASTGPTELNNFAWLLAKEGLPYVLGMRLRIKDQEALTFSQTFHAHLARGASVEAAAKAARLSLSKCANPFALILPVLYTSLAHPGLGVSFAPGTPRIVEWFPKMEIYDLKPPEGALYERLEELKMIGSALTGINRAKILSIVGPGGEGKTVLVQEAVKRFAHAWAGGVYAVSLETLPTLELFLRGLSAFLGLGTENNCETRELERAIIDVLSSKKILIVLDNAETLVYGVESTDALLK